MAWGDIFKSLSVDTDALTKQGILAAGGIGSASAVAAVALATGRLSGEAGVLGWVLGVYGSSAAVAAKRGYWTPPPPPPPEPEKPTEPSSSSSSEPTP